MNPEHEYTLKSKKSTLIEHIITTKNNLIQGIFIRLGYFYDYDNIYWRYQNGVTHLSTAICQGNLGLHRKSTANYQRAIELAPEEVHQFFTICSEELINENNYDDHPFSTQDKLLNFLAAYFSKSKDFSLCYIIAEYLLMSDNVSKIDKYEKALLALVLLDHIEVDEKYAAAGKPEYNNFNRMKAIAYGRLLGETYTLEECDNVKPIIAEAGAEIEIQFFHKKILLQSRCATIDDIFELIKEVETFYSSYENNLKNSLSRHALYIKIIFPVIREFDYVNNIGHFNSLMCDVLQCGYENVYRFLNMEWSKLLKEFPAH